MCLCVPFRVLFFLGGEKLNFLFLFLSDELVEQFVALYLHVIEKTCYHVVLHVLSLLCNRVVVA